MTVNLQSINAKKEAFWEAVSTSSPDIIMANETWLKPTMSSAEMMPPGYDVPIRNDRDDGYGGVLLATRNDLVSTEIKIDQECELTASKLVLSKFNSLILMSAYRPPRNDLPYAQRLCQAIRDVVIKFPRAIIWIGGDFNLPDID